MDLIDSLRNLSISHRKSLRDDDFFVDRLHHRYTVAVLVLFCAIVTTNQYAGEPINCWFVYFLLYIIYINFFNYCMYRVPAQFTGSFELYTNRLCWLQNTYFVSIYIYIYTKKKSINYSVPRAIALSTYILITI